jgi:hypothetical protein
MSKHTKHKTCDLLGLSCLRGTQSLEQSRHHNSNPCTKATSLIPPHPHLEVCTVWLHSKCTQAHTLKVRQSAALPVLTHSCNKTQLPTVSLKVSSATRTSLPHHLNKQALSAAAVSHLAFKVLPVHLGIQQQRLAGHTPQRNTLVHTQDNTTHASGRSEAAAAVVAAKAAREGRLRGPQPAAEIVP